ncbi:hypothetical protein PG985_000614 [Apiospora marii]|uniref:uncharacterized protein n=1 Tax=Apiospora marii TaxID=335849 RepID=UPI00312E1C16
MADIESQGQGDGKTERPSYTRLCTRKILPICLAICVISIFSAAIVCTSLDKPVPPNAVIVISTIAGCLLLLIFAGYLKIYHDRNGMDKVHPRAEQALKAFRDGFVSHICCVEMDDYAIPHITRSNNPGEGEKTAAKENGAEGNIQSGVNYVYRHPPERKPLSRSNHTVQGPRDQYQTPVPPPGPSRRQDPDHNRQQQYRQSHRPPPAEQYQNLRGNRPPPVTNLQPRPVHSAKNPELSRNLKGTMQGTSFGHDVPQDLRIGATPTGNDSPYSLRPQHQTRRYDRSAEVSPLNPTQPRTWAPNSPGAYLVSVPDAAAQLQAILGDTFTSPLKSFAKPTRSIHHEGNKDHYRNHSHQLFGSPYITPTQSRGSSAYTTMTNASSTSPKTSSSSNSSILLSTPPPPSSSGGGE